MSIHEVVVPDIGDSRDVEVAELLVAVGATVAVNDALMVLESDKASVEVTATVAGIVREIAVQAGDKVAEAQVLARIETAGDAAGVTPSAAPGTTPAAATAPSPAVAVAPVAVAAAAPVTAVAAAAPVATTPVATAPGAGGGHNVDVVVPDLGDAKNVVVSEILVAVGATVKQGQALVVLESDKASMEIEASADGVVARIGVVAGQEIADGTVIAVLTTAVGVSAAAVPAAAVPAGAAATPPSAPVSVAPVAAASATTANTAAAQASAAAPATAAVTATAAAQPAGTAVYAGPAVRKTARELGVDLAAVTATGPRGRVVKDDVSRYVKRRLQAAVAAPAAAAQGNGIAPVPTVDFTRFGPIQEQKLPRVQRVGGVNLHRSWLNVPHVTHHDEADITDLEVFRKSIKDEAQRAGVRVTPLAFLLKACARVLQDFPKFNASLGPNKDTLIYKRYFNVGVAVDTEDGLVVPVVKAVEQKGIFQLAREVADLSERARAGKLKPDEMAGGTFSISSLGILGGTGFTPIINAPEVAILGVARLATKPVWNGKVFEPRELLPLSLSYDHRVVNGADAARFTSALMSILADMRRTLL